MTPASVVPVCRRISVRKSEAASRKAGKMKPVFGEVFCLLASREHEVGAETPPSSPHILPAEDVAARGLYLGRRRPHGLHGWGRGPSPLRRPLTRDVGPSWVTGLPLWVRTGQETPHPHPQGLGCVHQRHRWMPTALCLSIFSGSAHLLSNLQEIAN